MNNRKATDCRHPIVRMTAALTRPPGAVKAFVWLGVYYPAVVVSTRLPLIVPLTLVS